MTRRRGEGGYAIVAAVASIGAFAAIALLTLSQAQVLLADTDAEAGRLQAVSSAEAGLAIAIRHLLAEPEDRWSIDGRTHVLRYGDARLRIRIEDERGKVPLNMLNEALATRLLEHEGLDGERMLIARDSLLDWLDGDDDRRPFGAEEPFYRASGIRPPNNFIASIDELGAVRGFDAALVERLRPLVSASVPVAAFDPRYAHPEALAVMQATGASSPLAIDRARELDGQRTAIEFTQGIDLTGRALTISVEATLPDHARAVRRAVVELTGQAASPYRIQSYQ